MEQVQGNLQRAVIMDLTPSENFCFWSKTNVIYNDILVRTFFLLKNNPWGWTHTHVIDSYQEDMLGDSFWHDLRQKIANLILDVHMILTNLMTNTETTGP